jgi:DTW domain-containing protein YfiP
MSGSDRRTGTSCQRRRPCWVKALFPVATLVVATVLLPRCRGFSSLVTTRRYLPNVCGVTAFLHQSATTIYALSSSSSFSSSSPGIGGEEKETTLVPFDFLAQVELSVARVLKKYQSSRDDDDMNFTPIEMLQIPQAERETVGVALHLDQRLRALRRNNDCLRCWMQRAHCICSKCPPVDYNNNNENNKRTTIHSTFSGQQQQEHEQQQHLNRIFLLMHHKEIGLKVDTAKLILACFPHQCRLVVAGISSEYQDSMKELEMALQIRREKCLVLFPDDTAQTFQEILLDSRKTSPATKKNDGVHQNNDGDSDNNDWDIIVIDGTWTQARRMMSRYLPTEEDGGPRRVQLSAAAVATLDESSSSSLSLSLSSSSLSLSLSLSSSSSSSSSSSTSTSRSSGMNAGHQLRRHAVTWRQVGTFGKSFEKGNESFYRT